MYFTFFCCHSYELILFRFQILVFKFKSNQGILSPTSGLNRKRRMLGSDIFRIYIQGLSYSNVKFQLHQCIILLTSGLDRK